LFTRILGTGGYLPQQVRTNADLERMVDTSDAWIIERTGIKERRIAAADETVASMGAIAAKRALEAAAVEPSEIDLVICATTTGEKAFPSSAVEIAGTLGINGVPAFDLAAACAGFSYGYCLAHSMIMSGQAKKVLIIGSDMMSRACDPNDRSTIILFGDGAGALVLGASEEEGTLAVHMSADPQFGPLLSLKNPQRGGSTEGCYLYMKGNDVFKHAVVSLAKLVTKTLEMGNLKDEDLDFLVPHQANLRIIAATAKKLHLDMSQVIVTLDKQGNTSSASVALALDEGIRSGRIQRGNTLLLESFGGGFTWASALVRY
jgi:3-oxoacyl-[acyl-carrier-protein] synthase-3